MKKYDYLIVGAGLFGSIFAYEAKQKGKTSLVIDKRDHVGGNLYCENMYNINVHKYGAHIFHTDNEEVWNYVNKFVKFNRYTNSPLACYENEFYNLPFNMNTFYKLWGTKTPKEAKDKILEQVRLANIDTPKNLEEQAIKLVGIDIYEKLIKGYTEKQWGQAATSLPPFIIKRLPVRFTYDNNYFNDRFQGVPIGGYNILINNLLKDIDVKVNTDFFNDRTKLEQMADKVLFTGMIDEFYDYKFGPLEYRSLNFKTEVIKEENYQGNAVINYTDGKIPYTRIIEHKHFESSDSNYTVITKEYPAKYVKGKEPYYPINNSKNNELYEKYKTLANKETNILFGGRLADYKYYDMHNIVFNALKLAKKEL